MSFFIPLKLNFFLCAILFASTLSTPAKSSAPLELNEELSMRIAACFEMPTLLNARGVDKHWNRICNGILEETPYEIKCSKIGKLVLNKVINHSGLFKNITICETSSIELTTLRHPPETKNRQTSLHTLALHAFYVLSVDPDLGQHFPNLRSLTLEELPSPLDTVQNWGFAKLQRSSLSFSSMTNLKVLRLIGILITGINQQQLASLTALEELQLVGCGIEDSTFLQSFVNLIKLDLSYNFGDPEIPFTLTQTQPLFVLTNLTQLNLGNKKLTDAVQNQLQKHLTKLSNLIPFSNL